MCAAANALQENVSEGMNNITRALGDNNTDTLKQEVESHTKHWQLALTQFDKQSMLNEEGEGLRKQLYSLSGKVKEMEQNEKFMSDRLN